MKRILSAFLVMIACVPAAVQAQVAQLAEHQLPRFEGGRPPFAKRLQISELPTQCG